MSVEELERELIRWRSGRGEPSPDLRRLPTEEALAYRNEGNVPDASGRSLRLVLHVTSQNDLAHLDEKRRRWEPDYLEAPAWRREGSKPVNVVPLRENEVEGWPRAWWEDEEVGPLEEEWGRTGRIDDLTIPAEIRGFVFKTVLALRASGRDVTVDSIVDAVARWLEPEDVERLSRALRDANSRSGVGEEDSG